MLIFKGPLPPKVYGLYTCENVDIYGQSLRSINNYVILKGHEEEHDAHIISPQMPNVQHHVHQYSVHVIARIDTMYSMKAL